MSKLETKLVDNISGKFIVDLYQRGYRWGELEVKRLLDDVYNLLGDEDKNLNRMRNAKNYCLQPVVVKNLGDNNFELIDGQQRLTTLFLIYKFMNYAPNFSLEYKRSAKSAQFLENIDFALANENIDFYFMANAYKTIKHWFEEKISTDKTNLRTVSRNFENLFAYNVQIIWYEVDETEDSIAMFTRLNIGKIPLTSAELVKAMFLSRENLKDSRRQDEIALQWDNIEKDLHNDSLWYFLTNNAATKYQTRIDLILDLMSGKRFGSKDKYATFFYFDELKRRGEDLNKIWEAIVKNFLLLKDWRENHEFYHKIGYLIASGYRSLAAVYNESQGKTKKEFSARLDKLIKDSVKIEGGENYSDWNYNEDADKIRRLLLLFNVESVRQNGKQSQWFPFDKYKFGGKEKNSWSLEHIHAVNSENIGTNQERWREWLRLHKASLENSPEENKTLIDAADNLLERKEIKGRDFLKLQNEIKEKLSPEGTASEVDDSIANLALLKCEENSALSNSVFDVKRNEIIELDMAGAFIPFCTKMAFLKYYTKSEKNQIHFWSANDRRAYLEAINRVLKDFLAEPIKIYGKEG